MWDLLWKFAQKLELAACYRQRLKRRFHFKKLMNKKDLDEIDTVLMNAITPQHTQALSTNGIWGANDPSLFKQIPVRSAMESYVDFYVQLIKRWDALEL